MEIYTLAWYNDRSHGIDAVYRMFSLSDGTAGLETPGISRSRRHEHRREGVSNDRAYRWIDTNDRLLIRTRRQLEQGRAQ